MEGLRQRKHNDDVMESAVQEKEKDSHGEGSLPTFFSYGFIFGFLLFVKIIAVLNQKLPVGLLRTDETTFPDRFIAERAENDLLKLVSIGPKVTGSYECEVLAPRMLRLEIQSIAQNADAVHSIQQDLQKPKGSFYMGFKPYGFQSIYENIQNIAVRLGPKPPSNHSVLVNCHFDTVPDSPGASDNGLNCVVMLEILRKLSSSPQPLKHNIIFLFNGAEENVLQAAHGFITKHHWSKEVRLVVNLDAGGAGGREILFQASPDHQWILKTYARVVPWPFASTGAQEIFESGLIPSDTDFRIFRDFGKIPGVDMAHIDNGYVYHTRMDTMDFTSLAVLQHTGDNVLALLRALANASEIEDIEAAKQPEARLVYYDVFGAYMFVYSHKTGILINFLAVAVSFYSIVKIFKNNRKKSLSVKTSIIRSFFGAVAGTTCTVIIALVLDASNSTMAWYARPYLIIPLYAFPYTAAALYVQNKIGGVKAGLEIYIGGQILTSLLLLFLTILGIKSSYILMLLVIFPAIAGLFSSDSNSGYGQIFILTASSLIGLATMLSFSITTFSTLIPISGRFNSATNPEFFIAGLTSIVCFTLPLLRTVANPRKVAEHLYLVHFVMQVLIVLTPFVFPYSSAPLSPALQRFNIYHTEQTLYNHSGSVVNYTSGVHILPLDRNGLQYVSELVPELNAARTPHCNDGLFCQFPLYNSRLLTQVKSSFWLPFSPPQIFYPTKLELVESNLISPQLHRMKFSLKGPDHITLVISPHKNVKLGNWTLGIGIQPTIYEERAYYLVYYSDGRVGDSTKFSLDLEIDAETSGPLIDVSVIGHYQHQKGTYTPEFSSFLNKFPAWTQTTSWITSVHGYVF